MKGKETMSSVTEVTKRVKQPKGGYLNLKDFECISLEDNLELAPIEHEVICY